MKINRKRKLLTVILSVLCAVLLCCSVGMIGGSSALAFTVTSTNNDPEKRLVSQDDLYDSAKGNYNIKVFDALAAKILGKGKKTTDLYAAVQSGSLNAADFRTAAGDDVTVKFGGLIWTPVFLSTTDGTASGKPILTLWQAGLQVMPTYDKNSDFSKTQDISPFTDGWKNSGSADNYTQSWKTPVIMYGSSYMRAVTLNNGGYYSSVYAAGSSSIGTHKALRAQPSITDATSYAAADTDNKYYEFARGDISKLIVAPAEVSWQADQKNSVTKVIASGSSYPNLNNDSYNSQGGITYSFEGKTHTDSASGDTVDLYGQWKDDKVWLPSITEVGNTDGTNGIWKTSYNQKKTDNGTSYVVSTTTNKGVYNYTWLRTGVHGKSTVGYYISAPGNPINSSGMPCNAFAVRPAIHLDLSQVLLEAPSDITTTAAYDNTEKPVTFNEQRQTVDYLAPDWYSDSYSASDSLDVTYEFIERGDTANSFDKPKISGSSVQDGINTSLVVDPLITTTMKNAGKYKVTFKLKNSFLKWADDALDYGTATNEQKELERYRVIEYTIKPKELKVLYAVYDTSGGGAVEQSTASIAYTADVNKTYKVDIKASVSTETIPSGTPAKLFPDCEIVYSGTANDGTAYNDAKTPPRLAGSYKAVFKDKNSATSNYELKSTQAAYAYTVDKAEVSLPSFNADSHVYNAKEQDFVFTSSSFDPDILTIDGIKAGAVSLTANSAGTEFSSADGYFTVKYDSANKKLSAVNAESYKVAFALADADNYTWEKSIASNPDKSKTFTVEKKELVIKFKSPLSNNANFNLKTSTKGSITAEYAAKGGGETPDGGTAEEPVLVLYYTFSDGSTTGSKVQVASDEIGNISLDVTTLKGDNNKFSAGTYSLLFELASDTANAVNKNYKLGVSAAQDVIVTAGEASIDDLGFLYNTVKNESDGNPFEALSDPLKYEYDSLTKTVTEYKFALDFSGIDYLTYAQDYANSVSWQYADGSAQANKAGVLTVTAKIKVKTEEAANHSLPAAFDVTQTNKFKSYTNNGDGTATVTFEVEIGKREISVAGKDIPLKYQPEGGSVTDYDPKNPPEYNGKPVTISLPHESQFPHGIKKVEFDEANPRGTQAKTYTIGATVTLDDNHCLANGNNTLHVEITWEISKEVIKLAWSKPVYFDDYFNDSSVAHLQVMLLGNLNASQESAVKYTFYKEVDGAPDTTPLSEAELKALCTNDRFTDPNETWLYVKAELTEDGAKKYKLEDDANKNPKRFKLGGQMTLIELKVDEKINGYQYGSELDLSKVFSLINSETGDEWDSSYYEIRVYKDGVDLGTISEFNPSEKDAGIYTFEINIKNEYAEDYTLDKSNKITFEIKPKELTLPTLNEIIFSGASVNFADYLVGFDADLMEVGGSDYRDIRNVSKNGYSATITLKNPNYCWAYPSEEQAPARYGKASAEIVPVDATVAEYKWNIAPLVIDTTELWNKSKGGATLNLPQNVQNLIAGETLTIGYKYYDGASGEALEEVEFKGGKQFKVEAVMGGFDAENGNVVFKNSDTEFGAVSNSINYTVPQSGAAAAFGKVKDFVTKTWMGLPIWAWMLIALAILILLIIIIVVACKKRKSKEEREELRRRREEEREAAKAKQQAELELAKAKQEAELAKIRAQAASVMPAAAMAATAMAQPQAQQVQSQQPVQQVQQQAQPQQAQPVQQPQYQQPAMAQPAMQMPMQMAQQSAGDPELRELKSEIANMRAEQRAERELAAMRKEMELGFAKFRNEMQSNSTMYYHAPQSPMMQNNPQFNAAEGNNADMLGAVLASMVRNLASGQPMPLKRQDYMEIAQNKEESVAAIAPPTVYPPDAVITTTTMVDTTKKKAQRLTRDKKDEMFDIDGFYDSFEENK